MKTAARPPLEPAASLDGAAAAGALASSIGGSKAASSSLSFDPAVGIEGLLAQVAAMQERHDSELESLALAAAEDQEGLRDQLQAAQDDVLILRASAAESKEVREGGISEWPLYQSTQRLTTGGPAQSTRCRLDATICIYLHRV